MQNRLKQIRKNMGMTQQEFANKIGIKRNTIANYETGRNKPIDSVISLICREFNVNEEWLRTGKGEMFKQLGRKEEIAQAIENLLGDESNTFKERLINILIKLNSSEWEVLEKIAIDIFNNKSSDNTEIIPTDKESDIQNNKNTTKTLEANKYSDMTVDEMMEQTRILENLIEKKLAEKSLVSSSKKPNDYKNMA